MKTIVLQVEGMSCGHCTQAVEKAVTALEGVSRVTADLESKSVTVQCADTPEELIKNAIEEQGFDVVG